MTLALSKSSTLPEKPNLKSMHSLCLYLNSYSIYNSLFLEPSPLSWTDTFYPFGFSQCCIPASSLLERSSKELGGYWHHHTAPSSWDFPHANPFFGLTHTPSPLQFSKTLLGLSCYSYITFSIRLNNFPLELSQYFVSHGTFAPKVINSLTTGL